MTSSAQPEPEPEVAAADAYIDEPPLAPVEERPSTTHAPPPPPLPPTMPSSQPEPGASTSGDWKSTLTRAQEVHASSGATDEEHDLLGKMILLVQSLGSTLHHTLRDKSDLETQLQLAKSNLQLAQANTEMLEDALRDRGANSRDVGWRRSKPPGEVEGQPAIGPRTPSTPQQQQQQQQPLKDTRFLARFRFGATSGSTPVPQQQEPSPDSPQPTDPRSHLTSASLPSLPLSNANGEPYTQQQQQQQTQSPDSAGSGSRPTLPQLNVGPASGTAPHYPGAPPNTAYPGYTGPQAPPPPLSAASPIPRPATAHPSMPVHPHPHARTTSMASAPYSTQTHMTFPGPGGTFYVTPLPAPTREQHAQVIARVQRLEEACKSERAARLQLEQELESLTQSLFEEANKMVATERKARAAADDELNSIRDQRDALHAALKVVERCVGCFSLCICVPLSALLDLFMALRASHTVSLYCRLVPFILLPLPRFHRAHCCSTSLDCCRCLISVAAAGHSPSLRVLVPDLVPAPA
ncbi:hypothetical protein BKA62DRAFT_53243 [Auriculariales sp. MPI-PUGE-AT-0066]|nr:hypothetical protein BKA62DRAFT_53243 [Auriculariales sp. MPI-PUGE-AT-0066]